MDTIFMNSKNSKTSKPYVLILNFTDKIDLRKSKKGTALSNRTVTIHRKRYKISYNNSKFEISAATWNDEFELQDRSYSISDIQDYFKYIFLQKHEIINNPSLTIYVTKSEKKITFKVKTGYYLQLLTPETMILLWSTENKIAKHKSGKYVPQLEITQVILVHCSIVNNDYQKDSWVSHTFFPNEPIGSLLDTAPTNFIFLKTFGSEFQEIKVWFTDQSSQQLEIEDRMNLTLVIKWCSY